MPSVGAQYSAHRAAHAKTCLMLALVLLFPLLVCAQGGSASTGTGGSHIVQGHIYFPSGRRADRPIQVKLQSNNAGDISVTSDVSGSFTFGSLAPGNYTVVVDAGENYEPARETVYIDRDVMPSSGTPVPSSQRRYTVMIQLQLRQPSENHARASVINAALASVPPVARDWYQKAVDAVRTGDNKMAIDDLKSALYVCPEFPLALNELGVQYLRTGQALKAAEALGRAVRLSPQDFPPRLNYGIALLNQRRFGEAEDQLRTAINMNSSVPTAHMYLGIVLAVQRKLEEAEKELKVAIDYKSSETALAHRYLGGIFLERRQYQYAAAELKAYLKLVPNAVDANTLREKVKNLLSKS